jgi:hypothetical protein
MRAVGPVVGLVIALGAGFVVFQRSASRGSGQMQPREQIGTVAIRQRLVTIGESEQQYLATHGAYATLEELAGDDLLPTGADLHGYSLSGALSGGGFTITARPTEENQTDWPTLEITQGMQVTVR